MGLLLVHGMGANCQDKDNQTLLLLLGKGKAGGITGNRFMKIINELGTDPSTDNNLILGDISVQQVRQGHYSSQKHGLGFALQSLYGAMSSMCKEEPNEANIFTV
jgi:hypothetical protein